MADYIIIGLVRWLRAMQRSMSAMVDMYRYVDMSTNTEVVQVHQWFHSAEDSLFTLLWRLNVVGMTNGIDALAIAE